MKKPYLNWRPGQKKRGPKPGQHLSAPAATEHPTTLDIAWAAGIFEGEGGVSNQQIQVTQKDPWILERLKALFGGSISKLKPQIYSYKSETVMYDCHRWQVSGARARGFGMTIYKFLSPRRQEQIRKILTKEATCV